MKTISIIMPVYNEEQVIEKFNTELFKVINTINHYYLIEVVYVVDKCKDNTLDILTKISDDFPNVTVISLSKRFGHQMSLVAGIDHCEKSDAIIMMDCDLEQPPALIPELLKKYEEGFDIVNTSREYNEKISIFKSLTSKMFYKILNTISEQSFIEGAADFRLISQKITVIFKNDIREHNQFLRGLFQWVGFNQTNVCYKSDIRQGGKSKYTLKKLIDFALNGVLSFSKIPLKISIFAGIIISLLGFLYAIYSIIVRITFNAVISGWTSIIVLQAIIGGLTLVILGIIGEYIGSIFDEVKDRPLYIVDKIISKSRK